jgi:hypothetical protein
MNRALDHLKSNAIAYLALFVALGGTSYAAVRLPAGSVGTRALKNHSVTPIKFDRGSIAGYVRDYAQVNGNGVLVASRPRAHIAYWNTSTPEPGGQIDFDRPIPSSCFAVVSTEAQPFGAYASAQASGTPGHDGAVTVNIATSQRTGDSVLPVVDVVVICPE